MTCERVENLREVGGGGKCVGNVRHEPRQERIDTLSIKAPEHVLV